MGITEVNLVHLYQTRQFMLPGMTTTKILNAAQSPVYLLTIFVSVLILDTLSWLYINNYCNNLTGLFLQERKKERNTDRHLYGGEVDRYTNIQP